MFFQGGSIAVSFNERTDVHAYIVNFGGVGLWGVAPAVPVPASLPLSDSVLQDLQD